MAYRRQRCFNATYLERRRSSLRSSSNDNLGIIVFIHPEQAYQWRIVPRLSRQGQAGAISTPKRCSIEAVPKPTGFGF